MLDSKHLQENPGLYVFLPLFYTVWSDAVLTPSEIKAIRNVIDAQPWLSPEEKEFLVAQLNPSSPPSADQLKSWLDEISTAGLSADKQESLIDIGVRLASRHTNGSGKDLLAKASASLSGIEKPWA